MRKVKEKISGNYDLHIKWQLEEQRITAEIVSIKLNNVSRDTTKIFLDKISNFFGEMANTITSSIASKITLKMKKWKTFTLLSFEISFNLKNVIKINADSQECIKV